MPAHVVAITLLAASLGGCGDDFDPAHKLSKTRILAIKAEPPSPNYGQTATLTPLFYSPDPTNPSVNTPVVSRINWSWCPLPSDSQDGYTCPINQAEWNTLIADFGLDDAPSLDLGEGPLGIFPNPFPTDRLAQLCSNQTTAGGGSGSGPTNAGTSLPVFDCPHGFPVLVRMLANTSAGLIEAVMPLHLPIGAATPSNANPTLGGIRLTSPSALAGTLDEAGTVTVPRNREISLELDLADASAEDYDGRTVDPETELYRRAPNGTYVLAPTKERLNIAWFAEVGGFSDELGDQTAFDPDAKDEAGTPIPFQKAREMIWTAPELFDDKRSPVLRTRNRFIVIVRDNRGGVAWTTARLGLEDR